MMVRPRVLAPLVAGVTLLLAVPSAWCQGVPLTPLSAGVYGNVYTAFQANTPLKRPGNDTEHVVPFYQYLDLSGADPKHNLSLSTFLRAHEVAYGDSATFDVYNAYVDYQALGRRLEMRAGRQILTEGENFTLLDGAVVKGRPLEGVELIAYGGYQHADLQPHPEQPDHSFGVVGTKLRTSRLLGALMSIGYQATAPNDTTPRHLLDVSFNRVVPFTDFADVYSRLELDIAEANPAFFNAGVGLSVARPLYVNLEYDTYKPDKSRDAFLQDRIFDVFSVSRLQEARLGLTYHVTTYLDAATSYSFATYDKLDGHRSNGNIWKAGLTWNLWQRLGLKAFNGLYLIEGKGRDRAVGINCGVSEEVLRGLELHAIFAFANFDSLTGQDGNAYSYIVGTQYLVARSVSLLAEVELNTNPDFEHDVRGNFGVSYYFSRS
jgi:hypothetical protein